jgi:hypothetical protein
MLSAAKHLGGGNRRPRATEIRRCAQDDGVGRAVAAIVLLVALLPAPAAACATCYGAADAPMTQGLNQAIGFLLGCVGLVFAGVVKLAWDIRRRTRERRDRHDRFRLIEGGAR